MVEYPPEIATADWEEGYEILQVRPLGSASQP